MSPKAQLPMALAACLLAAGMLALRWQRAIPTPRPAADTVTRAESTHVAADSQVSELQLVVMTSSRCGATTATELRDLLRTIVDSIRHASAWESLVFSIVLAVIDEGTEQGLAFAQQLGTWDELSLGRGWRNSFIERYVWSEIPGAASIPQVLLLERQIRITNDVISFGEPELIARKIGSAELHRWVELGVPF